MFVLPVVLYAQESDAEAAAAFFADDATYKINDPPPGARELYAGREEIMGRLMELVAINANMAVDIQQTDGGNITSLTRFADDPLSEMGVDYIEGVEEYIVEDGKITAYEWALTEESGAKIAAALAAPASLPVSGGERFPVTALIIAMGGLLLLLGGTSLVVWYYRST